MGNYSLVVSVGKIAESGVFLVEPEVQPGLGMVEEERVTVCVWALYRIHREESSVASH